MLPDWLVSTLMVSSKRFLTSAAEPRQVFVGDSFSHQHWSLLRCLLGKHVHSDNVTEVARLSCLSLDDLSGI